MKSPNPSRRVVAGAALVVAALMLFGWPSPVAARPPLKPNVLRVLFPEGFTSRQMVDRVSSVYQIARRKWGIRPKLTGASYRAALARVSPPAAFRPSMPRRSLEGFLFPALYEFFRSDSGAALVERQLAAFSQRWNHIDTTRARTMGHTPYDILTVASMVERETVAPEERRLVAAVIYNRLAKGMPLAIDATIRYGLGIPGTRPLTRADLASDSPYNTRRFRGLPPTPISNPGVPSLRAAGSPARVNYLYYVRKPDRVHHFFTADETEFCNRAREYGYGC